MSILTPDPLLMDIPVGRAAYSDRTAWLMAIMSQLAYLPFEGLPSKQLIQDVAKRLAKTSEIAPIVRELTKLTSKSATSTGKAELVTSLGKIGFRLIKTFSVTVPPNIDTQAFLAKLDVSDSEGGTPNEMLVLAFRGTEPDKLADIKTDLDVVMQPVPMALGNQVPKVHRGMFQAYRAIADDCAEEIAQHPDLPLYVTGHSLGGALAVIATRYIANKSIGACYTFGGPRVCNAAFGNQIFTPIYRLINATDIVPHSIPSGFAIKLIVSIGRRTPGLRHVRWIWNWFDEASEYEHVGSVFHLSAARKLQGENNEKGYEKVQLRAHRPLILRLTQLLRGKFAPISDHAIDSYIAKLAAYARERHTIRTRVSASPSGNPAPEERRANPMTPSVGELQTPIGG